MSISPHLSTTPPPTTNRERQQQQQPAAAMAEAATPLLPSLPDEIVLWEILVRLDPKSLLRCRAVARAWRRAASARRLLQAHHDRQPTLPLIHGFQSFDDQFLDIIPFDHRARADDPLQPVARLRPDHFSVRASCDGLLVLSVDHTRFAICNPATRQYAPLPMLSAFMPLGMYPHGPTGEYRLLLYTSQGRNLEGGSYVFTLGSGQPPRLIGCPEAELLIYVLGSALFRGNLHWLTMQHDSYSNMVMVFDTIAESCRQMRSPVLLGVANMFEADGMLGVSSLTDAATAINIWMTLDYEAQLWALKYRVELGIPDYRLHNYWNAVVAPWDGGLLVLLAFNDCLLEIDIDGKVVASFHHTGLSPTQHRLKQTLVSHAFFPTLEGYAVNALPFI